MHCGKGKTGSACLPAALRLRLGLYEGAGCVGPGLVGDSL